MAKDPGFGSKIDNKNEVSRFDLNTKPAGPIIKKASGPQTNHQKGGIHDMLNDIEDMDLED